MDKHTANIPSVSSSGDLQIGAPDRGAASASGDEPRGQESAGETSRAARERRSERTPPTTSRAQGETSRAARERRLFNGGFFQRFTGDDDTMELRGETMKWRKRLYEVWTIIGICALVWVFGWLLNVFALPVGIILWCLVLVFCLRPVVNKLHEHGVNRGLGTFIAYLLLAAIVVAIVWLLFSPGVGLSAQFAALNESLPQYSDQVTAWLATFNDRYSEILQNPLIQSWIASATDSFYSFAAGFAQTAASSVFDVGTFIGNTCLVIGFAVVISFWILMELPGLIREFDRFVDEDKREDSVILRMTLSNVIGGYIKGTLLQCFIIGLACGIGYAIVGLPSPAALGIITGLLNIIPVIGPWLGGALAAGAGIIVNPTAAIASLVIAIVVQQIVYTFVSPLIMSDAVDIHPALVLFGLVCGGAIGGAMSGFSGSILGMLASIPIIAAAKALLVYYYEKNTGKRIVAPDGVLFQGSVSERDGDVDPRADASAPLRFKKNLKLDQKYPERHSTPAQRRQEREFARKLKRDRVSSADGDSEDGNDKTVE